jgi:N-dimethylarginine dimethylaminohydrolase
MLLTEWNQDEAIEVAREEAQEEYRQYFIELLDQGLTIREIKQRLNQKKEVFRDS